MTAPTTTMRIDEKVKSEARPILEELGLNISSATNIFLKAIVRCQGLPFDLKLSDSPPVTEQGDFIANYLSPLLSQRNASTRIGFSSATYRDKLVRRRAAISQGRRSVV